MTHLSDRFSWRFDQALTLASLAHAGDFRKGTVVPYITHPTHVARLLDRHGFSEDVVIAGLLHDVLEDANFDDTDLQAAFRQTFAEFAETEVSEAAFRVSTEAFISARFGRNVLGLVRSVTEVKRDGLVDRSWRVRKDEQLAHIAEMSRDQAALKAADALHNSRSVLRDVQRDGLETLGRFNCTPEETLWYYGAVADGLRDILPDHPLHLELDAAVFELTEEVNRLMAAASPVPRCRFCAAVHKEGDRCNESAVRTAPAIENQSGQRIRSLAHWFRLAPPKGGERQWVNGRSARETARTWYGLSAPTEVLDLLRRTDALRDFRPTTVIAELVTLLDDFGEGRNHDLVMLGVAGGKRVLVGIEAKSDEELGPRIGSYLEETNKKNAVRRADGNARLSQVPTRIENLTRLVFGDRSVDLKDVRYQLLHGLAGTLIEAQRRKADVAVFLVHAFTSELTQAQNLHRNEKDVLAFAELLQDGGSDVLRAGRLAGPHLQDAASGSAVPMPFYLGLLETCLSIHNAEPVSAGRGISALRERE